MEIKVSNLKNSYGKVYVCGDYTMTQVNDKIVVRLNGVKVFSTKNTNNNWFELKRMIDKEASK